MLMGEFLTAVHHKLPVNVVIYNNSAFGLITLEAESVGLPPFQEGIEFPNPDFAALARAKRLAIVRGLLYRHSFPPLSETHVLPTRSAARAAASRAKSISARTPTASR